MKVTKIWCVVSAYYKHGETQLLNFFSDSAIKEYLTKWLASNGTVLLENSELKFIINEALNLGQSLIDDQDGWGITEIKCIDLESETVTTY